MMAVIIFSGCSQASEALETKDEGTATQGEVKDELILAIGSEPDTGFDPTTGWGRYGSPLFQSTLLKRDHELNIIMDLATDYHISEDGLVWTVILRDDVFFSDGEPLTVKDVQFTYETAMVSGSVLDLTVLDRVEIAEPNSVLFHLKQPQSTFIESLLTLGIVPEHAYNDNYGQEPVGSGPFTFVQWDKGQQLIVKANPLYYSNKPFFQKITFLFLNEDAAFAAAKSGQVDMASIPASFSLQEVAEMTLKSLPSVDSRGIMFPFVPSGEKTEAGYPIGNDVTADMAIRKAINLAVNRDALVEGVLEGQGAPAYSIVDNLPWWNPQTVIADNDMELAKLILTEGGWEEANGDGILVKGDLKAEFTLIYPASDSTRQSLAIATADMLKPLGINILVEGKSWDEIEKLMHSNAVMMGWGSHDPLEMYNIYSGNMMGVEWYNPGYYSNETVDAYFEKALGATSEEEANDYWKKAQWDGKTGFSKKGDSPWAWLVNLNHLYLVNENLDIGKQKIQPHGHGWPITDNLADWKWKD
ncbi:MAG: ABC transporter substrate-binding protein [Bacillus sp. (in: Bacteria)]|nr:ABC transporter substrate-binding protein [Bacillus sp. (in: firmicutes)]